MFLFAANSADRESKGRNEEDEKKTSRAVSL
jgi:hypothetical protein